MMKTARTSGLVAFVLALALLGGAASLVAQEDDDPSEAPSTPTAEATATDGPTDGRAGYADGEPVLDGAGSVPAELARDDLNLGSALDIRWLDGLLGPWFDAKRRWNQKYGLKLQLSYQSLHQVLDQSPGEENGAAGRAEFQGMWTLVGRKTDNPGALSFRYEYRDTLGGKVPPSSLEGGFGGLGQTGTGFSDFGSALTEFSWRQSMYGGRFKFGLGKISATSWYNGHALSAPKSGFQNSALQSSTSKPLPGRGIGLITAYRGAKHFGVVAGIHDANGKTAENPFDTIDQSEFFKSVEFRYVPTTPDRVRYDQVRLQLWHQDAREEAGTPSPSGRTAAASLLVNDQWMPFLVAGVSDGEATIMEADVTVGVGIGIKTAHGASRDVLGFGVNWGRPSSPALQEQYTWELFYRLQLFQHIAFTPSVQLIDDPAANPDLDQVWVGSLRARFTF